MKGSASIDNEINRALVESELSKGHDPHKFVTRKIVRKAKKELLEKSYAEGREAGLREAVSESVRFNDPLNPPQLRSTFVPPPFATIDKMLTMQDVDSRTRYAADRVKELRSRKFKLEPEQEQEVNRAKNGAIEKMLEWSEGPFRIEKPSSGSLFHKLKECWLAKDTICDEPEALAPFFADEPNVFIIEHDWAKAFAGAKDIDGGEWPLPYDRCVFEFQISGKRIIVLSMLIDGKGIHSAIAMHIGGAYWSISSFGDMTFPPSEGGDRDKLYPINLLLHQNVRALCIALDAEVAVTSVTRAPHRLNSIRERAGKPLLSDFHTVNLAKRSRVEALPSDGEHEPRWKVRLHFRRGHWRHFQNHKTWIKWMLVGDPDLGFIDKHYRA